MAGDPFLSRQQRFGSVGSTNDVVHDWLAAGIGEVCLAVADEQTAGRGRGGRGWVAARGAAMLASVGFRPTYLRPELVWRLAGAVALAMADTAEEVAGLPNGTIRLKWPNDLVVESDGRDEPQVRKLAGVLGETDGLGTGDPRAVVGIGVNADWDAADFPPEIAPGMTSLRMASGGRGVDLETLLAEFLGQLEARIVALRAGHFDVPGWTDRQVTTGRMVRLVGSDGGEETRRALGVDSTSGGLLIEDDGSPSGKRLIHSAEIRHVRLVPSRAPIRPPAPVEV